MTIKVWTCKIGGLNLADLPNGADSPMRKAVENAYKELTGIDSDFNFSGWGDSLTDIELEIVDEMILRRLEK